MANAKHIEDVPFSGDFAHEEIDEELIALPAPPRGRRLMTMSVMALSVAVSIAFLISLQSDIQYFFSSQKVTPLGEVTALNVADIESNTFVKVGGTPMASGTVFYSRVLLQSGFAVFPLAGQRDVFVQVEVNDEASLREIEAREFSGRIVTFGSLGGRFASVHSYLSDTMQMPVSKESFVILADEPPSSYIWSILLALLCLLFVGINVWMLMRWFKPIRMPDADATA